MSAMSPMLYAARLVNERSEPGPGEIGTVSAELSWRQCFVFDLQCEVNHTIL